MTRYSTLMAGVASPDPQVAAEYAREALRYEPDTGEFYWKERPPHHFGTKRGQNVFNAQFAGTRAGAVIRGYRHVQICGRLYACHRLAWLMVHDSWPSDQIDHINRQRDDNRIANLRVVTNQENQRNAGPRRTNSSGVKGVYWHKVAGMWAATIRDNNRRQIAKRFNTFEGAVDQRRVWEVEFGYSPTHARLGPQPTVSKSAEPPL